LGEKGRSALSTIDVLNAEHPLVLALDLGSSSFRAIVYDRLGREIEGTEGRIPYTWRHTPDGGVEADPDLLLGCAFDAVDQALAGARKVTAEIRGVGISTFWHNIMGVGAGGRPETPLYSWADARSAGAARTLRKRLDEEAVRRRTGVVFHPSYPAVRLYWLRSVMPDTYRAVHAWMSLGEYLALRCFGRPLCSISMASGTGLLDQRRCEWDDEILALLGLSPERFSPLGDIDEPISGLRSQFAGRWPELASIPWLPAMGDGATGNIGTGCVDGSRAALNIGTSGALRVLRRGPVPEVPRGVWNYRADRHRVLSGGAVSNGGNVYQWMHRSLALGDPEEVERALRVRPPAAHGLVVLPFLNGERSPDWPIAARGAVIGLTPRTTPLDLLQAGLESVAFRIAMIWDQLGESFHGVREIIASGGALRDSPAWLQMIADVLGRDVTASGEEEGSSRGAALAALEVLRAISADNIPTARGRTFQADPERYKQYRDARLRNRRVEEVLSPLQSRFVR
jgi:gluconokinase